MLVESNFWLLILVSGFVVGPSLLLHRVGLVMRNEQQFLDPNERSLDH